MIRTSKCYIRGCKHYKGVKQPDGTELSERCVCAAFPDMIPIEIAYGDNEHLKPIEGQGNEIVFEEGEMTFEESEDWGEL